MTPRKAMRAPSPGTVAYAKTGVRVPPAPQHVGAAAPARAGPSAGVLVGTCLWAVGLAVTAAVVTVWALVVLALGAPAWYPPAVGAAALTSYATTLGGLVAVRIPWLRWRLLGVATAAVTAAAWLTVVAG